MGSPFLTLFCAASLREAIDCVSLRIILCTESSWKCPHANDKFTTTTYVYFVMK